MSSEDENNQDGFRFEGEIEKLLRREPFEPFEVILTSGDRYTVTGPFSLAFRGNSVVLFPPKQAHVFFRKSQIVAVEVPEPAT